MKRRPDDTRDSSQAARADALRKILLGLSAHDVSPDGREKAWQREAVAVLDKMLKDGIELIKRWQRPCGSAESFVGLSFRSICSSWFRAQTILAAVWQLP